MDTPEFFDLAQELETRISELYELVADGSGDPPTAARLKLIASEEQNHANAIRRGKEFYSQYPDLFSGVRMGGDEVLTGNEELKIFRSALMRSKIPLVDSLKKLAGFEKRFERIHMGASVQITEPTLKKLFSSLNHADQSHLLILMTLIDSIGG